MNDLLLVFMKSPEPGQVKTRLAATIGHRAAAELYRQWIGIVLQSLQPLRSHCHVVGYCTPQPPEAFAAWEKLVDALWPQPEGDLGQRLAHGFRQGHEHSQRVVAIGTDCLEIDAALLAHAFALLHQHDVVFGPAADGGYYLLGTSADWPDGFGGVRWSSPHTLQDHLALCNVSGKRVALLPCLADIDTWADWTSYCQRHDRPT
jgi:hypothetical protein